MREMLRLRLWRPTTLAPDGPAQPDGKDSRVRGGNHYQTLQ